MIDRDTFKELKNAVWGLYKTLDSHQVLAEIKILYPDVCAHFTVADCRRIAAGSSTVYEIIDAKEPRAADL